MDSGFVSTWSTSIYFPHRPQKRAPAGIDALQALHWSVLIVMLPCKYFEGHTGFYIDFRDSTEYIHGHRTGTSG
jgi:hypothetical protein